MHPRWLASLFGIVVLAGCEESVVTASPTISPEVEGRWISVVVANHGDTDHELAVVGDPHPDPVGVAEPATIPGHASRRVRFFVPDHADWIVTSNGMPALFADDVDGWCGRLDVTINVQPDFASAEVPSRIWMGPGNCDGPPDISPTRLSIYMRDQSAMVMGWKVTSGQFEVSRGLVTESPSATCILVPVDWTLYLSREQDIMDRPDPFAGTPAIESRHLIPDGEVTLSIDVDRLGNPTVTVDQIHEWWGGPPPQCP